MPDAPAPAPAAEAPLKRGQPLAPPAAAKPPASNMEEAHQEAAEADKATGARSAKRKAAVARELAMMRDEYVLRLQTGDAFVFPSILSGETTATVIHLDPASGSRDEYTLSVADYRKFALIMVDRLKAAGQAG